MSVKKVIQLGHPSLRANNKTIDAFTSKTVKAVIQDLKDTLYETDLIGIAAPQIAENYMVFVTHPRKTKARKMAKDEGYRVFINPKIIGTSIEEVMIYEGCGSVVHGGLFGPVSRPKDVTIEAFDENGDMFSLTCDGLLGRVIQHEYDHLLGIEFLQKVTDYSQVLAKEFYIKTIDKRGSIGE